ncbi:hypothetical protein RvY_16968-2 [Ramazzottius varieornatus]|uniref:Uncharacterized protein n=1 Tax=Ramazzottius varieornatus TaxID=947166 RepID=A0A1D1W0G1_RAMVA|nr:hypothetical protein RvY_16968-2 [Ramazzottius varieornatus]
MNHFFAHRRQSVDLNAVESFIRRASMITNLTEPEEDPSIVFAFRAGDAFTNTSRLILLHGGQKCRLQNLDKEALKELKEKENLQMNDMSFNASTVSRTFCSKFKCDGGRIPS